MAKIECTFWGVGQGLFSSGQVHLPNSKFVWVYDCGSTSNRTYLNSAIVNSKQKYGNHINLLALSHFHADHINGVAQLLKNNNIDYLLLPYYPLGYRLLVALSQNLDTGDPIWAFYQNPIAYMLERFEIKEKLLLVPAFENDSENDEIVKEGEDNDFIFYERTDFEDVDEKYKNKVALLRLGKAMQCDNVEFFPYTPLLKFSKRNKAIILTNHATNVEVIWNDNKLSIEDKIKALKNYYNQNFGARNLNYLSLFLYIRKCNKTQNICTFHETEYGNNGFLFLDNIQNSQFNNNLYKNAILYTGDGELKKQSDLQSLVSALGQDRIERIFAFQVPHHGAKGNSYKGLAADLKPNMSIFSAGENSKYKHPHPVVFFDFKTYTPIFVNESNTLTLSFS
ncbi:ComEC/Rec2 family competence protein [Avibacterium paragallinarum]|uniref:hypothetical protein n=1 Tax=Avibacterium paragallinarum TaxID=728 RepID=UPI00397DF46E